MARFTTAGGSGDGTPGAPGPAGSNGADGADALWNYLGEYNGGASYAVGDVVTFDGQLWYRANANGGNVGDTPSEGFIWDLLAQRGADGSDGSGGLVYLGNYVSGNGYVTDLAVVRGSDNNLYIAKANGGLADPVGNTAEWDIFSTNTGGGTANIADFVFTDNGEDSSITLPGDKGMRIEAGEDSDLFLTAGDDLYIQTLGAGDDIHIQAADDIRFTTNNEDFEVAGTVPQWSMDSDGEFHLPGQGLIWNPSNSSGDGYSGDTIHLVPNDSDNETEQRIIIDPTGPNHIHIRAGGVQDYSTADLILGGERAGVRVSDTDGTTVIQSKQEDYVWTYQNVGQGNQIYVVATAMAEPDINDFMIMDGVKYVITSVTRDEPNGITSYETTPSVVFAAYGSYTFTRDNGTHFWNFNKTGYLNGPTETGHLRVTGIINDDGNLEVQADQNLILSSGESNGEYLRDSSDIANQIATLGDINAINTGDITFEESSIIGGAGVIELVPDGTVNNDSFLVIQPTDSNHIHIRAGGSIDSSTAELILGGERTKVQVSDTERLVLVSTRPPGEEASENQWVFGSDGLLTGPAPDSLIKVNGLYGKDADPLFLLAPDTVVISGDGGEFLDDPTVADNQIATIGDLPTGATGTFETPDSKLVTVTNGIITSIESLT